MKRKNSLFSGKYIPNKSTLIIKVDIIIYNIVSFPTCKICIMRKFLLNVFKVSVEDWWEYGASIVDSDAALVDLFTSY